MSVDKMNVIELDIEQFQQISKIPKLDNGSSATADEFQYEEILETDDIVYTDENYVEEVEQSGRDKLDIILENQNFIIHTIQNLDARLTNLEEDMKEAQEERIVHSQSVRECKELLKRVHHSVCRITGESDDYNLIALSSMLPLTSLDAVAEMEEKLKDNENVILLKTFMFKTKDIHGTIDHVMRQLFSDEVIYLYNYDGKCNKKGLKDLTIVDKVLFEAFSDLGKWDFEKGLRKFIELSHNRLKSKKNRRKFPRTPRMLAKIKEEEEALK